MPKRTHKITSKQLARIDRKRREERLNRISVFLIIAIATLAVAYGFTAMLDTLDQTNHYGDDKGFQRRAIRR